MRTFNSSTAVDQASSKIAAVRGGKPFPTEPYFYWYGDEEMAQPTKQCTIFNWLIHSFTSLVVPYYNDMLTMVTIQDIIQRAKADLPTLNEERLLEAYHFAEQAHREQVRFSGEPYINHPMEVTSILLDFHPDEDSLVASLLHDVAEDTHYTLDHVERGFGTNVRDLCWGLVKLSKVRSKLNDPQVENLRKLFFAMAKDFRVILIKLCDRLHNMSTLHFVRPEKRIRIAQETLNIYAPIAARLGIYRLKSQLEDLCFQYLHPHEHQSIREQLVKTEKWREKYIEIAKKILKEQLTREGIQTVVDGRVKSLYSIFRKMQKKNKTLVADLFDVFAMRVVLPDIYKYGKEYTGHLYTTLGIIHSHFTPLAHRFKDYVAVPKINGYRSLHTTVIGLGPKTYTQPTEIQIRTNSMHESAEFGIAAHWLYKEDLSAPISHRARRTLHPSTVHPPTFEDAVANTVAPFFEQQRQWISNLGKIQKELKSNQELIEHLQGDLFQDRIFVLTPRGDVKDLPVAATPVDFAYAVHTEIGHHCVGAKVNGSIVPLDHELKSGDVVEIITRKNAYPNQNWLSFVKTSHARNRIRNSFRTFDAEKHLHQGKDLLNEKLRQLGQPPLDDTLSLLRTYEGKNFSMQKRQSILVDIGRGVILPSAVLKKTLCMEELLGGKRAATSLSIKPEKKTKKSRTIPAVTGEFSQSPPQLIIGGEVGMPYHFRKCCHATLNDELVGYVTRGKGVSLHKISCPVLPRKEGVRFIPVSVRRAFTRYPVRIAVYAEDRIGLIRDISRLIADQSINIVDVSQAPPQNRHIDLHLVVEIEHFDQLDRLLSKLEKIPSVRRACKESFGSTV